MPGNIPERAECGSCGLEFTPTAYNQKYCKDCRNLGYKAIQRNKRELDRAVRRGRRVMYDLNVKVYDSPCKVCGKPVKYIVYNDNEPATPPKYCSNECRVAAHVAETNCCVCGKPMSETDDQRDVNNHPWTCGPECAARHRIDLARARNGLATCPVCGGEFVKLSRKRFCSKECYMKDLKSKPSAAAMTEHECPVCGKAFTGRENRIYCSDPCAREARRGSGAPVPVKNCPVCGTEFQSKNKYCSKACSVIGRTKRIADSGNPKPQEKPEKPAPAVHVTEEDKTRERNYILENGPCAICDVPYSDCVRMTSKFRYSPEGVLFRNGKLAYCPLFRSKKIKCLDRADLDAMADEIRAKNLSERKGA